MSFGVGSINVLLNVIYYFIPPPVKHVNSCLKLASGCNVAAGASVPGPGLFSVCDERLVLGGGFRWLMAKHLWVIQPGSG